MNVTLKAINNIVIEQSIKRFRDTKMISKYILRVRSGSFKLKHIVEEMSH